MPQGNCGSYIEANLTVVEKESKTCLLILLKHVVLQAMGPSVLLRWMILKAATLLI